MGDVTPCASLCGNTHPHANADDLASALGRTCARSGFPAIERVYAGSSFCDRYFLALDDGFHEAVGELCVRYDLAATLVIPIAGQAHLARFERRVEALLEDFGDLYDEIVVNDPVAYSQLRAKCSKRLGFGRLFSRTRRDARYPEVFDETSLPELSPEALACIDANTGAAPLVELDPTSAIVDVSRILEAVPDAEISLHLPYCFATTGRTCSPAAADEPDERKFRPDADCALECLRMDQGSRVDNGVRYVKHGRTYFYENPACMIAGTPSWRIVYAASRV